jgi:hypothetical protein
MFSRSRPLLCVIATGISFGAQQPTARPVARSIVGSVDDDVRVTSS